MSLSWKVPHQARYQSSLSQFVATFNVPIPGQYDFGVAGNAGVLVFALQPNTVYLIERATISGDVASEDFSAGISVLPSLALTRLLDGSSVYNNAIPVSAFVAQQEQAVWVKSARDGDSVRATLTGSLNQLPAWIGRATISVFVSFGIYAIESTIFSQWFLGEQRRGGSGGVA